MDRDKIIKFCEEYLEVGKFKDGCHNGLQVEGVEDVKKIVSGVTLSQKLIEKAIEKDAQMIMVHHGFFGKHFGDEPRIVRSIKGRLKMLLSQDINVAGFHLPLDAHGEIGNNASLLRLLGLEKKEVISCKHFGDVGFVGEFENDMDFKEFVKLVDEKLDTKSYAIQGGLLKVKRVGVIGGSAQDEYVTALELGADTYLTGDIKEHNVRAVEEDGINFINAGHYNTEKLGIQNLGDLVAEKFGVDVEFIDIPCEI